MFPSVRPSFSLSSPFPSSPTPNFPWTCLSLLLCAVGSFSEHLDQINGRNECVDNTDNPSKPPSEPASHMARQRLESTEKKKTAGKVTKSLSASALSLMIPGGSAASARMNSCGLCMHPPSPLPQCGMLTEAQGCSEQQARAPSQLPRALPESSGPHVSPFFLHQETRQPSSQQSFISFICFLSFSFLPLPG